jgi:hypothetical protein
VIASRLHASAPTVAGDYPTSFLPTAYPLSTPYHATALVSNTALTSTTSNSIIAGHVYPQGAITATYGVKAKQLPTPPETIADARGIKAPPNPSDMRKNSMKQSPTSSRPIQDSPNSMNGSGGSPSVAPEPVAPKPKNCKKSNRKCKRGVRLNFIDISCEQPPYLIPPTHDWRVIFQDESREIASEYVGGFEKYSALKRQEKRQKLGIAQEMGFDYPAQMPAPVMPHQQLPPQSNVNGMYQTYAETAPTMYASTTNSAYENQAQNVPMPSYQEQQPVQQAYDQNIMMSPEQEQHRPYLDDSNEVLYMQVFVEEVGLWMDSMDPDKHFSRLLPFQALRQQMLKHAILACGVRYLTLINSQYPDEQALNYYNTATQLLLKSLQNPDRDSVLCATTATILNVYEVMSEKDLQRMNHIAGARALIKECRWDATATGIGAACFWLNIGLELFSCLHFNWSVAWDPDTWGVDMNMNPQQFGGNEEDWCHKMLYILAKINNFRSSIPKFREQSVHAENMRLHTRHQQWLTLKQYCDKWDRCVPQTMHPMAYVPIYMTRSKSAFPEVWLIKRATIVARLFYHTAMALLGEVHPMVPINPQIEEEVQQMKLFHARQICGIVAHVKDRLVCSPLFLFNTNNFQRCRIRLNPLPRHRSRIP